jgi:transcriptional regulator with XRE-family HTH domain
MMTLHLLSNDLDRRRRALGITYKALAKRSGVPMPTVVRILSGSDSGARYANVQAIASALGDDADLEQFRETQARRKAQHLVAMVQGTSGLEGQALDEATIARMVNQTVHELLAGSGRKLWSD